MDLTRIDLNLLVALDALLAERHVTRAGQRLHLSQSATSAALRRLRRVFDDPLLIAHGRELQLTPLARALAEPVHEVLTRIAQLTEAIAGLFAAGGGVFPLVSAAQPSADGVANPHVFSVGQRRKRAVEETTDRQRTGESKVQREILEHGIGGE